MSDRLHELLLAEFGGAYEDLRAELPANPSGRHGPFGRLDPERVEAVVLHHTAAPAFVTWRSVAAYHVGTRGFAGIGYHIGVRQGRVAYLGDVGTARAHVLGRNDRFVGVCVAGNYQTGAPADEDAELLRRLVVALDEHFGRPVAWRGHRDVMPAGYTVCPGAGLHEVIPRLRPDGRGPASQLELALRKWADTAQRIEPNEGAALYQAMRRDGFWPISGESGANGTPALPGLDITAQLARSRDSAGERIYFWDGAAVRWIDR